MSKWLIRTSEGQILGPVSREKMLELYRGQSVSPADEVCRGNDHWFHLSEEDLLQQYLLNGEEQSASFRHQSSVTGDNSPQPGRAGGNEEHRDAVSGVEVKFPPGDELSYPEVEQQVIAPVLSCELPSTPSPGPPSGDVLQGDSSGADNGIDDDDPAHYPSSGDLDYPEEARASDSSSPSTQRDDRYLFFLLAIVTIVLSLALKKYTSLFESLGEIFSTKADISLMAPDVSPATLTHRVSKRGKLRGIPGVNGIALDVEAAPKVDFCQLFEHHSFPIVWHLAQQPQDITLCPGAAAETVILARLASMSSLPASLTAVKQAVAIFGAAKSKRMVEIHQIKKKGANKVIVEDLLQEVNRFLQRPPRTASDVALSGSVHQAFEERTRGHLLGQMAQVAIFDKLGNVGRSHALLHDILSRDKDFFLIAGEGNSRSKEQKKLHQQLLTLMEYLQGRLPANQFKFLTLYLKYYWPEFVGQHFPVEFSLREVRKLSQTFRWGVAYPALWLDELRKRSTQNDVQQYLVRIFRKAQSKQLWQNHFWLFAFFTPGQKKTLDFVQQEMTRLRQSPSSYERFLFTKVLGNDRLRPLLKGSLALHSTWFNVKRGILHSMLKEGKAVNFSLLHLVMMGDYGEELLWWKIL